MTWLTANDPEPPCGTTVVTKVGERWVRADAEDYPGDGHANWLQDYPGCDPESWIKVAGNYGPVRVEA